MILELQELVSFLQRSLTGDVEPTEARENLAFTGTAASASFHFRGLLCLLGRAGEANRVHHIKLFLIRLRPTLCSRLTLATHHLHAQMEPRRSPAKVRGHPCPSSQLGHPAVGSPQLPTPWGGPPRRLLFSRSSQTSEASPESRPGVKRRTSLWGSTADFNFGSFFFRRA